MVTLAFFYFVLDVSIVNAHILQGLTPHSHVRIKRSFILNLQESSWLAKTHAKAEKVDELLKEHHVLRWRTIILITFLNFAVWYAQLSKDT